MRSLLLLALLLGAGRDPFQPPEVDRLPPDTCSGGSNMTDPRAEWVRRGAGGEVVIRWRQGTGPGEAVGPAYFAKGKLESDDPAVLAALGPPQYRPLQELALPVPDLARLLRGGPVVRFRLRFPDRSAFTGCGHPGMRDSFTLEVALTFDARGKLTASELSERAHLGPI